MSVEGAAIAAYLPVAFLLVITPGATTAVDIGGATATAVIDCTSAVDGIGATDVPTTGGAITGSAIAAAFSTV